MKRILLFVLSSLLYLPANAQADNAVKPAVDGPKTYAVVVGISKYQNETLKLDYADRDATVFSDYLKSKAGGEVPEDNIRLLLNENATYAAIYDALDWLLQTCKKGDLVYFYFSGHGDMEHQTIFQVGFLLSFNTPRNNYVNNAVRIEDLNNIANTLSITNNANVVLITDACHSGKLAVNDNRVNNLLGEQLRTIQKKEIRITSCTNDQLSNEDEGWGGGRGVFSFYLVRGLKGMADREPDGIVTLAELRNYLDSSLARDPLLSKKDAVQTPVIRGTDNFKMAVVDPSTKAQDRLMMTAAPNNLSSMPPLKALKPQPQTYFFNALKKIDPVHFFDYKTLLQLPAEAIPPAYVQTLTRAAAADTNFLVRNKIYDTTVFLDNMRDLLNNFSQNKDAISRFNNKLAVLLSDSGQQVINRYLEGDAAELERRRYYNAANNGYDIYPKMFELAIKLTDDKILQRILTIKQYYFSGIATRLKIPITEEKDQLKLIEEALAWQLKAYELEPNAAYIENELGNLYRYKNDIKQAGFHLLRATQIAPEWALPWAGLASIYFAQKKYKEAEAAAGRAIALDPRYTGGYLTLAANAIQKKNLLQAEELYYKSIKLNSRDYLPFEKGAQVYLATNRFAVADSLFYEADVRKKGFHVLPSLIAFPFDKLVELANKPPLPCILETPLVEPGDASAHLAWALMSYAFKNEQDAEMQFKMVISLDPRSPLAFHYLGMLLYQNQRWAEAEIILKMAVTNGLDDSTFRDHYLDSLNKFYPGNKIKDCVTGYLRHFAYSKFLDHYFLGRVYESWNHFAEAEQEYRQLINMNRKSPAGYIILWSLQKKTGHYKDAENTIKDFALVNPDAAVTELASFYQEMIRRNPAERDWYYTGGRFFYNLVIGKPDSYPQDKKEIRPDVDTASYVMLNKSLQSNTFDATPFESAPARKVGEAGFDTIFTLAEPTDFPRTKGIEFLKKADSLYQDDEEAIADINIRIGDLYAAQGIPQLAYPYYKKVIEFKPGDANSRMKLIESYASDYQLTNALEQLDSLNSRHEINFEKQLMLAECLVHAGRFAEAAALLKNATDLYPYKVPQIATLNGRLQFMSGNPAAAITYYKDYLGMIPNDSCSMYSLARCYALSNKNKEAMQWLNAAVKNGFNYSWVLKYDTAFDQLRKSNDWKTTFASVKPKTWVNTMTGQ